MSKGNGLIAYEQFDAALDIFAEMEVNDEDIDFEIERKESGIDQDGNKQYINSIIEKSRKGRRAVLNKWFTAKSANPYQQE